MSVSKRILANLPALRRFARALFGSQVTGDAQVERVLHVLLDHPERINDTMDLRVILYRHLLKFAAGEVAENGSTQRLDRLVQRRLADLAPQHRSRIISGRSYAPCMTKFSSNRSLIAFLNC